MRNTCTIEGCSEYVVGRGLCRKHYNRWYTKGTTDDKRKNARGICSIEDCGRPHQAKGLCANHWHQERQKRVRLKLKKASPRTCGFCGEQVDLSRRRRGSVSYCSRTCKEKAWIASGKSSETSLRSYYKRRYGLTQEEIKALLISQGGGCAICGETAPKGKHSGFHVDHDHNTGKVRGVLCHGCNVSLGHFRDNPEFLREAAAYLER